MIDISNLSFSYGSNTVLQNISLKLEEGRIYGLLGENGVGKTTLLTLLCGLKKTEQGSISIDGLNPYKRQPSPPFRPFRRQLLAFVRHEQVPQHHARVRDRP